VLCTFPIAVYIVVLCHYICFPLLYVCVIVYDNQNSQCKYIMTLNALSTCKSINYIVHMCHLNREVEFITNLIPTSNSPFRHRENFKFELTFIVCFIFKFMFPIYTAMREHHKESRERCGVRAHKIESV
jgi:hypothetical protein